MWDWKEEYEGQIVTLNDLPKLFKRKSFTAVYRPGRWATYRHMDALAHVFMAIGSDFLFCVDEATTATHEYREGGLCQLLRFSRHRNIDLVWGTQRPCRIPGVLISEVNTMHIFHLHNRQDLQALRTVLTDEQCQRVAALPPHESITVNL